MSNSDPKAIASKEPSFLDKIPAPLLTGGRQVLIIAGTAVATAAGLGVIKPDDATRISNGLHALPDALAALAAATQTLVGIVGGIVGVVSAAYGVWKSTRMQRIKSVASVVPAVVLSDPKEAATLPFNVISVADTKKPDFLAATIENRIVTQ